MRIDRDGYRAFRFEVERAASTSSTWVKSSGFRVEGAGTTDRDGYRAGRREVERLPGRNRSLVVGVPLDLISDFGFRVSGFGFRAANFGSRVGV